MSSILTECLVVYNMYTYANTGKYKYTGGLCCSGTDSLLISDFYLRHEERDKILTMLTILSWPHFNTWYLVMSKISVDRDPKNPYIFNGQNPTLNWLFFKILKFSGPSLSGMRPSTFQSHFMSGRLLWQWWLLYPMRASVKLYPITMHLNF